MIANNHFLPKWQPAVNTFLTLLYYSLPIFIYAASFLHKNRSTWHPINAGMHLVLSKFMKAAIQYAFYYFYYWANINVITPHCNTITSKLYFIKKICRKCFNASKISLYTNHLMPGDPPGFRSVHSGSVVHLRPASLKSPAFLFHSSLSI